MTKHFIQKRGKQMTNKKVQQWLDDKGIKLQESFADALKALAKKFQKENGIKNIEEVYALIGLKKQYLTYWANNPFSIQTKKL